MKHTSQCCENSGKRDYTLLTALGQKYLTERS